MLAPQSSTHSSKIQWEWLYQLKKNKKPFLSSNMLGYGSQEKENELSPIS